MEDKNGHLEINNEALNIIKSLEGNIAVCSVVGSYRTGKSFILSSILNTTKGFELGLTTESCTKGIWMWDTPIRHKNDHGEFNLILLDTEGLESPQARPKRDEQLFILSLLLSSFFIYNSKNVIDRESIKKLTIMNKLTSFIKFEYFDESFITSTQALNPNHDLDEAYIVQNSPDFVWVLRDFFLSLNGKSPKEYLLSSLEMEILEKQNENEIKECNSVRDSIKSSFKSLDCHCMPFPIKAGCNGATFEETMQNLDQIDWNNLNPLFQESIRKLCLSIKENIKPKLVFALPLSALAFSKYIEAILQQLNGKHNLVSLVECATQGFDFASKKTLEKARLKYIEKMDTFLKEHNLPLIWKSFEGKSNEIINECYELIKLNLNGETELTKPFFKHFNDMLYKYDDGKLVGGYYYEYRLKNIEAIKAYNIYQLDNLWKKNIAEIYFDGIYVNVINENQSEIDKKMLEDFKLLVETYQKKSFYEIKPEMTEAFNEWFLKRGIEKILKINDFSYEVNQLKKEEGIKLRDSHERKYASVIINNSNNIISEKLKELELKYSYQKKILQCQLDQRQSSDPNMPKINKLTKNFLKILYRLIDLLVK